ncbi:MAG: hypothetical protein ACYCTI_03770 [Acidimicrobiales bacterium]
MARERVYASNAERQGAYRARLAARQRALATDGALETIHKLEVALAKAERRAAKAEERARAAEVEAQLVLSRLNVGGRPAAARSTNVEILREQIRRLEAMVTNQAAELERRRSARPAPGPNRAERRAAAKEVRHQSR